MRGEVIDEFQSYLTSLGLTPELVDRAHELRNLYRGMLQGGGEQITGYVITDSWGDNGNRLWNSLWFFSQRCMMEVRTFGTSTADDLDFFGAPDTILYCQVVKAHYAPDMKANAKSKLRVTFASESNISGDLEATGENCDQLWRVLNAYILPRVLRSHDH